MHSPAVLLLALTCLSVTSATYYTTTRAPPCKLNCPYGLDIDSAGKPVCKCHNPCDYQKCAPGQRCVVQTRQCRTYDCRPRAICQEVCKLNVEFGMCDSKTPRYYFNKQTGQCEKFWFSGCGGNANNFMNQLACKGQCGELLGRKELPPAPDPWWATTTARPAVKAQETTAYAKGQETTTAYNKGPVTTAYTKGPVTMAYTKAQATTTVYKKGEVTTTPYNKGQEATTRSYKGVEPQWVALTTTPRPWKAAETTAHAFKKGDEWPTTTARYFKKGDETTTKKGDETQWATEAPQAFKKAEETTTRYLKKGEETTTARSFKKGDELQWVTTTPRSFKKAEETTTRYFKKGEDTTTPAPKKGDDSNSWWRTTTVARLFQKGEETTVRSFKKGEETTPPPALKKGDDTGPYAGYLSANRNQDPYNRGYPQGQSNGGNQQARPGFVPRNALTRPQAAAQPDEKGAFDSWRWQ